MIRKAIWLLLTVGVATSAAAQVNKCKGPNGKVIYSDAACAMPEDMQRVKTNQNTVDGSGDRRNAEEVRAKSAMDALMNNPPAQCKFGAFKYNDQKGKALANDAQQECLRNVLAEQSGSPTSDRAYRLWNDHHTLTSNKRNAAVSAAISASRRSAGMSCKPNPMGTGLDCQPN